MGGTVLGNGIGRATGGNGGRGGSGGGRGRGRWTVGGGGGKNGAGGSKFRKKLRRVPQNFIRVPLRLMQRCAIEIRYRGQVN